MRVNSLADGKRIVTRIGGQEPHFDQYVYFRFA